MIYDVDGDIAKYTAHRNQRVAEGKEPSDAELRAKGGAVATPRALVLIQHYARALEMLSRDNSAGPMLELRTVTRRLMEYVSDLEAVALLSYSDNPDDLPLTTIGMTAATFEQIIADLPESDTAVAEDGRIQFDAMATRLRVTESLMQKVAGVQVTSLILPAV